MTLATQSADGPWAAALFYVYVGDDLVFLSNPSSRHSRDLACEPRCAATIQDQERDWRDIRGLQVEGIAGLLNGNERERARRAYAKRFPFVEAMGASVSIAEALAHAQWYRLRMARLLFIDNSRGFGWRQEFFS